MTATGQDHELWVGQDAIVNVTITTDEANIDGWTLTGYWTSRASGETNMTVNATIPTAGVKVARLTITDTDSEALSVPTGKAFTYYDFQLWRTDNGSESPIATGTATVYRTLRSEA